MPCALSLLIQILFGEAVLLAVDLNMEPMLHLHNIRLGNAAMQQLHTRRWVNRRGLLAFLWAGLKTVLLRLAPAHKAASYALTLGRELYEPDRVRYPRRLVQTCLA